MGGKGSGYFGHSREHGLHRKGISTIIDDKRRFAVNNFVARGFEDSYKELWSEDAKNITDPELIEFLMVNRWKQLLVNENEETIIKNYNLFQTHINTYNQIEGARVGDFVEFPDGSIHRFTMDLGDGIQTVKGHAGSYHLGNGYMSYSGGLDPSIPKEKIIPHPQIKSMDGLVWTFMDDYSGGGRGIYAKLPFRVFKYMGDE